MAGNHVRVNTDQVAQIAAVIERLNKQLSAELQNSKKTMQQLAAVWEGEAASATITAFNEFSGKYFQKYEDVISQYVAFLRQNVDRGYFETETVNVKLSDQYRG